MEQLSDRLKDKHIENCKLEKLVEELTSNCENVSRNLALEQRLNLAFSSKDTNVNPKAY